MAEKDCISREELIDELIVYKKVINREGITFKRLVETIEHQPSVDAVEVVRCKECKNKVTSSEYGSYCDKMLIDIKDDDFCKWGEKNE